ncbi:MAG: isoprenylcysteine carboxylmethyltransferase family protein [Candidatus Aminicenantes bacterium]|nr:isoprenylcysteine carboxylmethyltransferase family protein [Candidatus Aminicenantes bacterium]MCJ7487440.1 isoprenylcysteine carboxylmethyltransferase family protein [Candidatus Aminicenantes bacterium]
MKFKVPVWTPGILGIVVMASLIFLSSGHLNYWEGWVYFGFNLVVFVVTARVLRNETGLIAERLNPGKGMKVWDKGYFLLSTPLYFAAVILAGIDAGRRHWTHGPPASLYVLAAVVYVGGQALFLWAKKVNPYFSSVARIQIERGQAVVREGPYRFCRHPGYLGGILFGLATPLVLGSYWALVPQGLAAVLLIVRTVLEDRMLKKELLWYTEYTSAVRFRLVPGVW